jgi:DNA-directed RNA polymerase subunit RPC12/RpoP
MVEPITEEHPDHFHIKQALHVNRCPDCDQQGFEPGARNQLSRDYYCMHCGSGFRVVPVMANPLLIYRIGRKKCSGLV